MSRIGWAAILVLAASCSRPVPPPPTKEGAVQKTQVDWKSKLTPDQYRICRLGGTEAPGSGKYLHTTDPGVYACTCCGADLFSSETKYDSGCGWPAFWAPIENAVRHKIDSSSGMSRVEAVCASCDSHLGHVFDDGPEPTGKRY